MSNPISSPSNNNSHMNLFPPLEQPQQQQNISPSIPTIKQVEAVLQTLFTHTDPSVQNEANKWLLEVQKSQYIVPMCLELMKSNQPFFSQFFGIQTLVTKVHSDWESLWSDEFRINIKTTVFNRFLFDVDNNQLFNSKICSCIAAIMIHCIPRLWDHSISDLLTLFHSNQSSDRIKKGSLDILTLLPLEFETVILSQTRRMSIKEEFIKNSENVLISISEYLSKNLNQQLNVLLLKCAKSWIRFTNSKSILKSNLLNNLFKVIENPDSIVEGLSLIMDLINFHTYHSPLSAQQQSMTNSIKIHSKDYENFEKIMVPIIRKLIALKPSYENACKNDNLFICRAFAETLSQIVECYSPIMIDLNNTDVQQCLAFLLEFCSFNREISELTFNAWCYLGEFYTSDNDQLQQIFAKLLQVLIEKASYPNDYLNNYKNNNGDNKISDSKDKSSNINSNSNNNNNNNSNNENFDLDEDFEDDLMNYRNNVCDVIGTCFEIIGADEFIEFLNGLLKNSCKTWQSYEVVLYLFVCVSPNIIDETENSNPLAQRLTSEMILFSLALPHHPILTRTILQVLEDYNVHIKRHPEILAKSFNYILSNIQHSDTANEALKILQSFSLKYSDKLYQNIDTTLKTLESLYNNLTVDQQKIFTESILQLLSFVAYNQKPNVLQRILNPIINGIKSIISTASPTLESSNSNQVSEKILLLISKMSILESSLDFGDDLIPLFKEFISGIWGMLEEIHSLSIKSRNVELSDQFWKVFWKIIHELGTETLFNVDSIFNYLLSTIKTFPRISSSTFNVIDLLLTLLSPNQTFQPLIQNLVSTFITISLPILIENNSESIPTIEKFFKVMVRVLELCPNIFYTSQHAVNIIQLSIRFLLNMEKDSLLSILSFYQQLFIKVNAHENLLKNYSKPIISNIFLAVINDHTRSLTTYFSDILFDWIAKYKDSKLVIADCIINANWLPNEIPITERERLTNLIISLANKNKFKSLILDISQFCNNQMTWDIFLTYEMR